jgi:hypothetical protein
MEYDDILGRVLDWIDCGSGYKVVVVVCRRWCTICTRVHPTARTDFANHLWTLIGMFPDAPWNWNLISANPNTTYARIMAEDRPWEAYGVLHNPNTPREAIIDYLDTPQWGFQGKLASLWDNHWVARNISNSPAVDWKIIAARPNGWWWMSVSANPNITWECISNNKYHPDGSGRRTPWSWYDISSDNPNITRKIVEENEYLDGELVPWDRDSMVLNPQLINVRDVDTHSHLAMVTLSMCCTWEEIMERPQLEWDWFRISANPHITMEIYEANQHWPGTAVKIPWDLSGLAYNPNFTWEWYAARADQLDEDGWEMIALNTFGRPKRRTD